VEFRQIRYALAVAKERSFTKAAERLNISQSAVSEQVKLLEEEAGFPLFSRGPRGIDVTERGRSFLYEAERIVGDVLSLSDTARRLRGSALDTFKIGMGSGMAPLFMPRLFGKLDQALREVRLEIVTAPTRTVFDDLHDERIDAGLALESDPDRVPAGLVFDRLCAIDMVLMVPPKHPLAKSKQPVDIGRLVSESMVMNELAVGYGAVVMSMFADIGTRPNILAVANNIDTMKAIVQTGKAIAIAPGVCADNEVALGVLKMLPISPARSVALSLFRRREPLSRRKETFIAALKEALADQS
jgi:DNA-binding transcriptional LysR family regulator